MTDDRRETVLQAELDEARWLLPVYAHTPVEPVRGEGAIVHTRDGRALIDFYGGHAVALLGYRHPRLLAALGRQAEELFFQSNSVPLAVRARAAGAAGALRARGADAGLPGQQRRRGQRERPAPRLPPYRSGPGSWRWRGPSTAAPRRRRPSPGSRSAGTASRARRSTSPSCRAGIWTPWRPRWGRDVAALIVEPIQGQAGAVDLGADYLAAARELTSRGGRPADLRRGAVRHGAHRPAVRGAGLRRHPGPPDHRQGARRRLPGRSGAGERRGGGGAPVRRPRQHLRRRPARLRADRGGDRDHRVRGAAGAGADALAGDPRHLPGGAGRRRSRATASCSACAPRGRRGGSSTSCWRRGSSPARAAIRTSSACCRRWSWRSPTSRRWPARWRRSALERISRPRRSLAGRGRRSCSPAPRGWSAIRSRRRSRGRSSRSSSSTRRCAPSPRFRRGWRGWAAARS